MQHVDEPGGDPWVLVMVIYRGAEADGRDGASGGAEPPDRAPCGMPLPTAASPLCADLWFDGDGCRLLFRGAGGIYARDLTGQQRFVLGVLLSRPGWWYNAEQLAERLRGAFLLNDDAACPIQGVRMIICGLRKKLGAEGRRLLRTKRDVGYAIFPER